MPLQEVKRTEDIPQYSWARGMISSSPPEELPDDAAQFLLNVEFDEDSNLRTRNGTTVFLDTGETARLTSTFRAKYSDGTVWILFTVGTKLYRCTESGGSKTDITGGLTLPNNTYWQWIMFEDLAIGVNKATSGDNPIKVNAAGTAAALGGSPPKAKYITEWNNRIWLVGAAVADQNKLFASAINLPEDWVVDDDAGAITLPIASKKGDVINGIGVFKGALYVYKRREIDVVSPIGTPATIPGNLRVDNYTRNVGTISGYSIQNVIDDQLFLSDIGVMSLTLAPLGELAGSVISRNIKELKLLKKTTDEIPAYVFDDVNQYIISIPSSVSNSGFAESWVLDYQKINQRDEQGLPIIRWVKMDGNVAGTAYSERLDQTYKTYLISPDVPSGNTFIYNYSPINPTKTFSDNGVAYTQDIKTKSYTDQSNLFRNLWHRFGASLRLATQFLTLNINWYYDNNVTVDGSYQLLFSTSTASLTLWGLSTWNGGIWNSESLLEKEETIWRQFKKNNAGRKHKSVALQFQCTSKDQGFILKFVQLEKTLLNQRRARTK